MVAELPPRQAEALRLIREAVAESGMPPTRAELAAAMKLRSVNAAVEHLRALARKGVIELTPHAARGIRLRLPPGLPVIGRVAAGSPILAEEAIERRLELNPDLFKPAADYFLRVRGDSMTGAGILDGDLLAVHRTAEARKNQIVVARLDSEVTVKRYRPARGGVWLVAENPAMEPIWVRSRERGFAIEGVVVGVIRTARP